MERSHGKGENRYGATISEMENDDGAGAKGGASKRAAARMGAGAKRNRAAIYAKRDAVGVATRVTAVAPPRGIGALPTSNASSSSFDPRTSSSSFSTAEDAGVSSPEQYESESRD